MMVTFVSQCEKNALKKTRRVLDAFANRIGDNVWQTIITQDGLNAVKKLLRRTASKNTAVSCHWIRSRARSELVWVVGKRDTFDSQGAVPVNSTQRNLLNHAIERDWHYLPLIKALTALSALLHDWGKASALFQKKLQPDNQQRFKGDPIRHEWISCLLLHALVQQSANPSTDSDWLNRLANGDIDEKAIIETLSHTPSRPLTGLPSIASLVTWLVLTHHRLPITQQDYRGEAAKDIEDVLKKITKEWGYENRYNEQDYQARLKGCFQFPKGLISASSPWLKEVKKWSRRLLDNCALATQALDNGSYRVILHHARLALMLGDHFYSSQPADKNWRNTTGLFANTDQKTKTLKQKLDEHLVGVAKQGLKTAHLLPAFETEPPVAQDIPHLKKRSPSAFGWQDKAVAKIKQWQTTKPKQPTGFFAVNMASTGCGKTFANAKVMRALSGDGNSLRYTLALGLRTLTLQTGDEYRERIGLDNSELAVLIGSQAVMTLHQLAKADEQQDSLEHSGSLSRETLLNDPVDFDCAIPEQDFKTVLTGERDRKFLYAPVLACTIDHMMAATETKRGGRYILPCLRLLSSDLVIDEIDDFTGNDLVAIGRLIFLAGMLGRKVMISSATIPPDMAEGYYKAYRDGWQLYCKTRNASVVIGCAWIDEFQTRVDSHPHTELKSAIIGYRRAHADFISRRVLHLEKAPVKRRADIIHCQPVIDIPTGTSNDEQVIENKTQAYYQLMAEAALSKHQHNFCIDPKTGLKVSFGVIRVANIQPCVNLAKYLLDYQWPENHQMRIMAYHSQQVLLLRHTQEQHLDRVLKRKEGEGQPPAAFTDPVIRQHLDKTRRLNPTIEHTLFLLVATPVEEVGRDHDFDWAVVEPSSFRSLIQLSGRVRRHRDNNQYVLKETNIAIMQYNLKGALEHHKKEKKRVFAKPGFEDALPLQHHNMDTLVNTQAIGQRLDAIPRIQKSEKYSAKYFSQLRSTTTLNELEHYACWKYLANYQHKGPSALQGYLQESWFLTALPQLLTPFREGQPTKKAFLVYNPDTDDCTFCEKNDQGEVVEREQVLGIHRAKMTKEAMEKLWLIRDFETEVAHQSEKLERSMRSTSIRLGELVFPANQNAEYEYNDQLGLVRVKK